MSDLYIKVVNNIPELHPYTKDEVRDLIYKSPNMLLPAVLTDKLIEAFGYYPVEIVYTSNLSHKEERYATNEFKRIYPKGDSWCVEMEQTLNPHLLQQDWDLVKKERNKLLLESDWIQVSDIVTEYTKKQYLAYRELVRDIVRIAEYPSDVRFPKVPEIEYIDDIKNKQTKDKREFLTPEEYKAVRDFNPNKENKVIKWDVFMSEWFRLLYNMDKAIVQNLIAAYTNTTLEEILGYE